MSDWMLSLTLLSIGFLVGFQTGNWLAHRRWVQNAKEIQRIEYDGRLYKVIRDD